MVATAARILLRNRRDRMCDDPASHSTAHSATNAATNTATYSPANATTTKACACALGAS